MTLRDVSLVDKDVTVAIVKIEHVDSEKMVFLTIKRLKTWGKFFDNRLYKVKFVFKTKRRVLGSNQRNPK